jgi:hypothetical protein
MTATKERGRVVASGMGGFLNPPTHPEHAFSVETDLDRRPCNRGGMSLSSAADCDWLDDNTRADAKRRLGAWQAPPIESLEIREWIASVLGYFRNCYRGAGDAPECWHAANLRIPKQEFDPVLNADQHAGVNLIRKYYPAYAPTADDFARACWGNKS